MEGPAAGGGCAGGPPPRRLAHRGHTAAVRGGAPAGRHGGARPRTDADDHGHAQPRHAGPGPRRRRPDGQRTVGTAGTLMAPVATTLAPETTKAALRIGERPSHKGGAEGTRTPDPHTASVVRYQLRHSPLPTRSGVSEPVATVQGPGTDPAQGVTTPRDGRRHPAGVAQPFICAMRRWLPKGSRRPKSMP